MKEGLKAGFAQAEITPNPGVALAGYAARKEGATGVHDQLFAHVAVLKKGSDHLVLINLDLVEVSAELVADLRGAITQSAGIPGERIMLCATHTHSGPVVSDRFGEVPERQTIDRIRDGTLKAFQGAQRALRGVAVRYAQGVVADLAKDRRSLQETADPTLQAVGFYADTELVGCLVNFALHGTVLGAENLLISADYPGYLRRFISDHHPGCNTLVLNGAAGNVNIGYSADASALGELIPFRTFEKAEQVGRTLAEKALAELEDAPVMENIDLAVKTALVRLPLKQLPTLKELAGQITELARQMNEPGLPGNQVREISIKQVYLECLVNVISKFELEGKKELSLELQVVRIGDVVLVGIPGEPFAEIGLAIKADWPGKRVLVVGYANGYLGYLITRQAYLDGGYEAETSVFASALAEVLVAGAREAIENLLITERN